jgi:hypothetical protein
VKPPTASFALAGSLPWSRQGISRFAQTTDSSLRSTVTSSSCAEPLIADQAIECAPRSRPSNTRAALTER